MPLKPTNFTCILISLMDFSGDHQAKVNTRGHNKRNCQKIYISFLHYSFTIQIEDKKVLFKCFVLKITFITFHLKNKFSLDFNIFLSLTMKLSFSNQFPITVKEMLMINFHYLHFPHSSFILNSSLQKNCVFTFLFFATKETEMKNFFKVTADEMRIFVPFI